MSDLTFPQPQAETAELLTANRRLTTAILGLVLLTGLIACLAYLAGRTVTQIRTETATVVRTEIPPGPVIVTPLAAAEPVTAKAPAAPGPPPGLYLQVGLMDPIADRSMQRRLENRGLAVHLAPMENSTVNRVLVGPIGTTAEQRKVELQLQADGFQYFLRRY